MTFTRTAIPDVILREPLIHGKKRSYFVETFRAYLKASKHKLIISEKDKAHPPIHELLELF